jgi:hypothetical protein
MTDTTYNGWKNWETWNVALWLSNDEGLYNLMRDYARRGMAYEDLVEGLRELGLRETPDGAAYNDSGLDVDALDSMMEEEMA